MAIKVSVGGKYAGVKRGPNPATAGVNRNMGEGGQTIQREFIGSGVNSYKYERTDANGVTHIITVRAHSVREANTLAATRGYKTTDREIKRRRSRSRRK